MAYEKPALMTVITMPEKTDLGDLSEFAAFLKAIPEVDHWFTLSKSQVTIVISCDSTYLSHRSPGGTHEFCRGWIVRGIVDAIDRFYAVADVDFEWEEIEWIPDRRQITHRDLGNAPRELRKVDLHSGSPVT